MTDGPPWRIEWRQEVRDDADGLFVPAADLPAAATVGDAVVIADGSNDRTGTVAEMVDDAERGRFARVTLE